MTDGPASRGDGPPAVRTHLEAILSVELEDRNASAFVHAGSADEPAVAYCLAASERAPVAVGADRASSAVAYDGDDWLVRSSDRSRSDDGRPADRLAADLADRVTGETVLTPAYVPHDAALYLEDRGLSLASSDVLERARATKTDAERDRIESVQRAAGAGVRRAAALLADAAIADGASTGDGSAAGGRRLVLDGRELTPRRLDRAIDEAIVAAGAYPAGTTVVEPGSDGVLRPGEPIVLAVAPRGPDGYRGGLVRTLVVESDGGRERRAHVAITQAFRSARTMLAAGTESVTAVEADLEAEIRAFGEDGPIETRASGIGLEPRERPIDGGDEIGPGSLVRLEAAVRVDDDRWIRLADVVSKREENADRLDAPSRSLVPENLLE
ncbi:M24 family metallopeptidase [Natrarchaeobius oligotrophus]|uniref:Peptidase M24 n=1 Tax=Natrarchaeobius chitinivorans TaxID=1679083 RepID=A0A3N6MJ54_NATCH|nr:M24 family metallopeptidase [Natrarchaeobius chitinivorans]RQH03368.1 peptidase M24 [Natrarchaeobius chitinivorans]